MTSVWFWMSLLYLNLFSSRHPEEIKLYRILYKDQICISYNSIKNRSNKTRIDACLTNNHLPFHENGICDFDTYFKKREQRTCQPYSALWIQLQCIYQGVSPHGWEQAQKSKCFFPNTFQSMGYLKSLHYNN